MTAREETVLPPIDPSITDENDWWEFTLTDVKVLKPGKMLYANVLEASDENPVQVIGCLELKKNQERLGAYSITVTLIGTPGARLSRKGAVCSFLHYLVLDRDNASKRIIIDDVTHYAYGQTEDRSVEIWVAGKAGWYNISPAKGYLPTFNRMVQAVDMLYFLMDRHLSRRKQLNPTFKSLCEQVSIDPPLGCLPLTPDSTSSIHTAIAKLANNPQKYSLSMRLSCFNACLRMMTTWTGRRPMCSCICVGSLR